MSSSGKGKGGRGRSTSKFPESSAGLCYTKQEVQSRTNELHTGTTTQKDERKKGHASGRKLVLAPTNVRLEQATNLPKPSAERRGAEKKQTRLHTTKSPPIFRKKKKSGQPVTENEGGERTG